MNETTNVSFYDLHTRIRSPILVSMLHINTGDAFLDLGSGTGYCSEIICQQKAPAFCMDISLVNLLSIKERNNKNLHLINADAQKLPFNTGSFDKVLCTEVLEHIKEDEIALKEISRILKNGGILVITVPCYEPRLPTLISLLGIKTVHDFEGPEKHHRKGYGIHELSTLLSAAGMVVAEHVYFSHFFTQLMLDIISISHLLVRRIFLRQKAWNWADIQDCDSSISFTVFKRLFPLFHLISKLDKLFFPSSKTKGFGLALKAMKSS